MRKEWIIHPFLFALFPPLFIFLNNVGETIKSEIFAPIILIILLISLLWLLLVIFVKDREKVGVITSVFLLLFFSYGHFYNISNTYRIEGTGIIGHPYLLFIWAIFLISISHLVIRTKKNLHDITKILNFVAAFIITVQLARTVIIFVNPRRVNINIDKQSDIADLRKSVRYPNIYYIILDAYARADIARDIYDYDNSAFMQYLVKKDFYIANRSIANYNQTTLSLASSLNLDYIERLLNPVRRDSYDRTPLSDTIRNSRVVDFLKQRGYKIIIFSSGYDITDSNAADIYIKSRFGLNEFQEALLDTTPIPYLLQNTIFKISKMDGHRKRILFTFNYLPETLKIKSPIFVFAHILCPHPPFVFDRNGNKINEDREFSFVGGSHLIREGGMTQEDYIREYRDQLIFVNSKIEATIDNILSKATTPLVIILQSDHGPGSMLHWESVEKTNLKERMSILNAYYFSDRNYKQLYEKISPVNTFRVIFNTYLGASYELLPDKSYFSSWNHPYMLNDITEKARGK